MKWIALLTCLLFPCSGYAGDTVLAWEFDMTQYPGTTFLLHLVTLTQGRPSATTRVLTPFPAAQCTRWTDTARAADTLCGQVCLEPGDYSLTLTAQRGTDHSSASNVLDLDLSSSTPCQAPAKPVPAAPPPNQATTNPVGPVVGAAVVVGAGVLGQQAMPSLPDMINLGCVSWHLEGPCFCGPTTPCITVSYWQPSWLIEVVKKPGSTSIPLLGGVLDTVFSAIGVPAFGGGGAGNATGAGMTNLHYGEVHVVSFPQIYGGPCSSCAPQPPTGILHYASEADAGTWRTATAAAGPLALLQPVGVWGNLFPRGGKVIHGSEVIASALQAFRGMSIAALPVSPPPQPDAHVVAQPTGGLSTCMQMAFPRKLPCQTVGTPPPLWETGTLSLNGSYVFIMWTQKRCCVNPAHASCGLTLLGGQGANLCILPSLSAP